MRRPVPWLLLTAALGALLSACATPLPLPRQIEVAPPETLQAQEAQLRQRLQRNGSATVHARLALVLVRLERADEAERHALRAVQLEPFTGAHLNVLGEVHLAQGRNFRALTAFSQAVALDEELLPAYVNLARTHDLLGEPQAALEALREALRREPRYYPARYEQARLLLETGELEHAGEAVAQALRVRPDAKEAQRLQIRIAKAAGRLSRALYLAQEALEQHPGDPSLLHELLDVHHQRQDWKAAREVLRRMGDPANMAPPDALLRAEVLLASGRREAADEAVAALLQRAPDFAPAHVLRGRLLLARQQPDEALEALLTATQHDPELAEAHYWQAVAQYRLGNLVQGDAALASAERLDAGAPAVRLLRIRRLLSNREAGAAGRMLERFLEQYPGHAGALLLRAEQLTLSGRWEAAEQALERIPPRADPAALAFARARLAYLRGAPHTVLQHTAVLMERGTPPWQAVYLHAAALGGLGRLDEAVQAMQPYLRRDDPRGYLHRLLGDLHHQGGDIKAAVAAYIQGLSEHPRNAALIEGISRVAMEAGNWALARQWLQAGLEQDGPMRALFLERLRAVQRQTGEAEAARDTLRGLLDATDPLLHPVQGGLAADPLFGMDLPGAPAARAVSP